MDLAGLRRHLHRFRRVRSMDGRIFFFRFWEPAAAVNFSGLDDRPELIRRRFVTRENHSLDEIVIARPGDDGPRVTRLRPVAPGEQGRGQPGLFSLAEGDVQRLSDLRMNHDAKVLAGLLRETFPDRLAGLNEAGLLDFAIRELSRMTNFGFRKKASLFMLLAWELHFGPGFEALDRSGAITTLLADPRPEAECISLIETRMAEVEAGLAAAAEVGGILRRSGSPAPDRRAIANRLRPAAALVEIGFLPRLARRPSPRRSRQALSDAIRLQGRL